MNQKILNVENFMQKMFILSVAAQNTRPALECVGFSSRLQLYWAWYGWRPSTLRNFKTF